jgi:hypothetical protein
MEDLLLAILIIYSIFSTCFLHKLLKRFERVDGKIIQTKYDNGDIDYTLRIYEIDKLSDKKILIIGAENENDK